MCYHMYVCSVFSREKTAPTGYVCPAPCSSPYLKLETLRALRALRWYTVASGAAVLSAIVVFFGIIRAKRKSQVRGTGMTMAAPPLPPPPPLVMAPQPLVVAPPPQAGGGGDVGGPAGDVGEGVRGRWRQQRWNGGRRWRQEIGSGGLGRGEEPPDELEHLDKGMVDKIVQQVDRSGVLEPVTGPRSPPTGLLLFGPPGTGRRHLVVVFGLSSAARPDQGEVVDQT